MPRSLAHRQRVLLHTAALHDLRRAAAYYAEELKHYDTLQIAVALLDLVVDSMGLDHELDREDLGRALAPLLGEMDRAAGVPPDSRRHEAAIDRVLGALRNDADRRRPFEHTYGDLDGDGRWIARQLEFRLVADHFHPSGRTVLRLSTEAVNLYLNALELDIEDAQAAAEAVVASQIARGRIAEAVQSARQARWQSIRYQEKIGRALRDTRRDVTSVDWLHAVPRMLDEALAHIETRLHVEDSIVEAARGRLEALADRPHPAPETEGRVALTEVVSLVRDCILRHDQLHGQLIGARSVFLEEQARQGFVPVAARYYPDLGGDVLAPLLALGKDAALGVVEESFPALLGGQAPGELSLRDLVLWQLRPRRAEGPTDILVEPADLSAWEDELRRFPPEVRADAEARLGALPGPTTLSQVLESSRLDGATLPVREAMALLALRHFAPEGRAPLAIAPRAGRALRAIGFFGDELELAPLAEPRERVA
jgi:hypothetical protein